MILRVILSGYTKSYTKDFDSSCVNLPCLSICSVIQEIGDAKIRVEFANIPRPLAERMGEGGGGGGGGGGGRGGRQGGRDRGRGSRGGGRRSLSRERGRRGSSRDRSRERYRNGPGPRDYPDDYDGEYDSPPLGGPPGRGPGLLSPLGGGGFGPPRRGLLDPPSGPPVPSGDGYFRDGAPPSGGGHYPPPGRGSYGGPVPPEERGYGGPGGPHSDLYPPSKDGYGSSSGPPSGGYSRSGKCCSIICLFCMCTLINNHKDTPQGIVIACIMMALVVMFCRRDLLISPFILHCTLGNHC